MLITILACLGFGALHQFHNCATDSDVTVTLYLPQSGAGNAFMALSTGESWSGPYAGSGLPSVLANDAGEQITLTLWETKVTKTVNVGRLHQTRTFWTLVSGLAQ